ncbi:MAG: alpha/beta fold hydrolase [Ilumatobacteraceae bacterium]
MGRARDVATYRAGYRIPNDLDRCAHDVACAVEMAVDDGAGRVVVMGHSFGGAVAVRAAVVMTEEVDGVVTFATQSAGCEVARGARRTSAAALPRRARRHPPRPSRARWCG